MPQDLPARGLAYDWKGHGPGARMEMLSPIGLDGHVTHDGANWLDKDLMRSGSPDLRETGFGLEMKHAMERRKRALVQRGDAEDLGQGRIRAIAADRGRSWTPIKPGSRFGGEFVGRTQLPSSNFAMIDNGMGFSLVTWNDVWASRLRAWGCPAVVWTGRLGGSSGWGCEASTPSGNLPLKLIHCGRELSGDVLRLPLRILRITGVRRALMI